MTITNIFLMLMILAPNHRMTITNIILMPSRKINILFSWSWWYIHPIIIQKSVFLSLMIYNQNLNLKTLDIFLNFKIKTINIILNWVILTHVTCHSQTLRARDLKLWKNVHIPPSGTYHMSCGMCLMSCVPCHRSYFF